MLSTLINLTDIALQCLLHRDFVSNVSFYTDTQAVDDDKEASITSDTNTEVLDVGMGRGVDY